MSKQLKRGDEVSWNTSQGKTEGRVVKKQSSPTKIKGHSVKASKAEPQYRERQIGKARGTQA